jgi:lysophospholipase L1-like esterase
LQTLDLNAIDPLFDGHIELRKRPGSVQPLRFPVAELGFIDPFTRWVSSTTTGVRLRLVTNSRSLRLALIQKITLDSGNGPLPANYELFVDGALWRRTPAEGGARMSLNGGFVGDECASLAFVGLPAGDKHLELWLPNDSTVSITALAIDDGATWATWPDDRRRVVFHGSSISHCMEAQGGSGAWPAVASALAGVRLLNLGWAGSCLLSGQAARVIRDQPADAIVLKLGINVWPQGQLKERTFTESAHAMISIIREKHPATPILLVSPIYSPGREDQGDEGGLPLTRMRDILRQVVDARVAAGDAAIRYLSGLALFGAADVAHMPDDLHPNHTGYQLMGERFFAADAADGGWILGSETN